MLTSYQTGIRGEDLRLSRIARSHLCYWRSVASDGSRHTDVTRSRADADQQTTNRTHAPPLPEPSSRLDDFNAASANRLTPFGRLQGEFFGHAAAFTYLNTVLRLTPNIDANSSTGSPYL